VIMLLTLLSLISEKLTPKPEKFTLGVSFSAKYARELGLDWQKTYLDILEDLQIKNLRLPTYWDQLEPVKGKVNFQETDYLLDQAQKHQAKVILAVGIKQPRWPECHIPTWVLELDHQTRQTHLLDFVAQVVERYKDHPALEYWQVENEPFVNFGEKCSTLDKDLLLKEVDLVRSKDPNHKIILTDSGEAFKLPITTMKYSDIYGTTLYRLVYAPIIGYFHHLYSPGFYTLKSLLTRVLYAPNNTKTIVVELQAEPWSPNPLIKTPLDTQIKLFPAEDLIKYLEFAKRTGFDSIYLWGVEWWYWMSQQGHPEYWQYVKKLISSNSL